MTPQEIEVVKLLGLAWTKFLALPRPVREGVIDDDQTDFRKAIHDGQRILMSFAVQRRLMIEAKETSPLVGDNVISIHDGNQPF
jgi:hypothetical protein